MTPSLPLQSSSLHLPAGMAAASGPGTVRDGGLQKKTFPRLPPLILILPLHSRPPHSCGPFHQNTFLILEVQIIIYRDNFPLRYSKSCWQACTMLRIAASTSKANSRLNQSWDLTQGSWCEFWAQQEFASALPFFGNALATFRLDEMNFFETALNSFWLKSLRGRVSLSVLLWCVSPS